MHAMPREKLGQIVQRFGKEVSLDPRRCEALLRDLCGSCRKEIFALTSAVREGIPAALCEKQDRPIKAIIAHHSTCLHENLGISQDLCAWTVETWAIALGVASPEDLRSLNCCPACSATIRFAENVYGKSEACPTCRTQLAISEQGTLSLPPTVSDTLGQASSLHQHPNPPDSPVFEAEIVSESAEDVFRELVRQAASRGRGFLTTSRAYLDKARMTLGINVEAAHNILRQVTSAPTPTVKAPPITKSAPVSYPSRIETPPRIETRARIETPTRTIAPPPLPAVPPSRVDTVRYSSDKTSVPLIRCSYCAHFFELRSGRTARSVICPKCNHQVAVQPTVAPPPINSWRPDPMSLHSASRLELPAIGLLLTGGLGILLLAIEACVILSGSGKQFLAAAVVQILVGLVSCVVVIMGARQLKTHQSHSFATTTAILAMLPVIGPAFIIGLPVGLWTLTVLQDLDVKKIFR